MADLKVGSTFVTLDADTSRLEQKFRAAGVMVEQQTAKIDRAVKNVGSGAGRTVQFGPNDGTGRGVVTGTIPSTPESKASAQAFADETKNILNAMRSELFGPVQKSLNQLTDAVGGGGGSGNRGGGAFNRFFQYSGDSKETKENGLSPLALAGRVGLAYEAAKFTARRAFATGQDIREIGGDWFRSGKQRAERESLFNTEIDPATRKKQLQDELDAVNARRAMRREWMDNYGMSGEIFAQIYDRDTAGIDKLDEYAQTKEKELRKYSGAAGAEERRMRRAKQIAFGYDQIDEQTSGQYGMKELIQSMESTRENTELLNFIAQRIPR